MVYHGVSRGCGTCRKRRKKCDETRPICNRCTKAKRTCLGYREESELIFRQQHFDARDDNQPVVSRPGRLLTGTDQNFENEATLQSLAEDAFFQDYCTSSSNRSLSRGYLEGLRPLLNRLDPFSDVAQALRVAAFASFGKKHGRSDLLHKANLLYTQLLRSFQSTILEFESANAIEILLTAVLLGLYEIIAASRTDPGAHRAHSQGVTAILSTEHSPFDIRKGAQIFQAFKPVHLKFDNFEDPRSSGILCAPFSDPSMRSLDSILVRSKPTLNLAEQVQSLDSVLVRSRPTLNLAEQLLTSSRSLSGEEVRKFREDAMVVVEEFSRWPLGQPEEWTPKTIAFIHHSEDDLSGSIYWPGKVETYMDFYVAAVWNTYRKARLLFLDSLIRCEPLILSEHNKDEALPLERLHSEVRDLATDIAASVPFLLTGTSEKPLQIPHMATAVAATPGKPLGGLLLLHPLAATSMMSITPPDLRAYFKRCLAWIGDNMGIGQASLLAEDPESLPLEFVKDGHVLVWAGMLVQPTS